MVYETSVEECIEVRQRALDVLNITLDQWWEIFNSEECSCCGLEEVRRRCVMTVEQLGAMSNVDTMNWFLEKHEDQPTNIQE